MTHIKSEACEFGVVYVPPARGAQKWCRAKVNRTMFAPMCTRPRRHKGDHVAHDAFSGAELCRWPQ